MYVVGCGSSSVLQRRASVSLPEKPVTLLFTQERLGLRLVCPGVRGLGVERVTLEERHPEQCVTPAYRPAYGRRSVICAG